MNYEEEEKNWVPLLGVILLVFGIAGGGIFYLIYGEKDNSSPITTPPSAKSLAEKAQAPPPILDTGIEESSTEILETLGVKVQSTNPQDVATQVAQILESGDLEKAAQALGGEESGISATALAQLQATVGNNGFQLKQVREVGELEINKRKRFALEWEEGTAPLFLDLTRRQDGKWTVEQVRLPNDFGKSQAKDSMDSTASNPSEKEGEEEKPAQPLAHLSNEKDSLTISDNFLQAALSQNFAQAKSLADTSKVSDAKIAAMCIIFEEGKYRLNPSKPLRAMFTRETTASFLANVLTEDVGKPAQFGVNLARSSSTESWKVTQINLDSLLADYAGRVAGGDVYYTPLVPNPSGGETLVIFFGFDEETLAPRTQRQLAIVSDVLKTDPNRKLTLSGHADALGSDQYNKALSQKRADSVKNFLVEKGVNASQIILIAKGESLPRRPNETETGDDNPDGRRANRRTEIYLDFGN